MLGRVPRMFLLGGLLLAACDYPINPEACAADAGRVCGAGEVCMNDGRSSYCVAVDSGVSQRDGRPGTDGPAGEVPTGEVGGGGLSEAGVGGSCTDECAADAKACQAGAPVVCMMTEQGCRRWRATAGCSDVQRCDDQSGSCVCANVCARGALRCTSGGIQQCDLQSACPAWGAAQPWHAETVKRIPGDSYGQASIAISDGRVQALITNVNGQSHKPVHADRSAGGDWTFLNLEEPSPDLVSDPLLRATPSGDLQAIYLRWGSDARIRSGVKTTGGMWTLQDVAPATAPQTTVTSLDLAIGANRVALVYDGEGSLPEGNVSWIRIKQGLAGAWSVTPIVNGTERASIFPSTAIDNQGRAFLSYFSTKFNALTFSNLVENKGLETDADPNPANVGYVSRIAVDSAGGLHVIAGGPSVRFFYRPPGETNWQNGSVASMAARDLRLVADATGGVHALISTGTQMHYARRSAEGTWSMTAVPDDMLGAAKSPDLAVDSERIHVIYTRDSGEAHYRTSCR